MKVKMHLRAGGPKPRGAASVTRSKEGTQCDSQPMSEPVLARLRAGLQARHIGAGDLGGLVERSLI
jgi:hypothetical protein